MPAELLNLKEQLQNLRILFEDAIHSKKSSDDLEKLRQQILNVQEKILNREQFLGEKK
jgi:hypothetical protein